LIVPAVWSRERRRQREKVNNMKKYLILTVAVALVAMVVGLLSMGAATAAPATTPVTGPLATSTAAPATTDGDTIQSGDQTAPDEATVASEAEAESAGESKVEEVGDENLPGGGHADPEGANVDHQFEGVE
jgi:hypothetical protein